jgi:hypothetical protein
VKDKIDLDLRFHPKYAAVGDTVEIYCYLRNRSWLPCPFVEIQIQLPEGLAVSLSEPNRIIRFSTNLDRRQEMEVKFQCYAVKRGSQRLQNYPVYVQINEGLGLHILVLSKSLDSHLVVMPSFAENTVKQPQMMALAGRIEQFHWLHPDESLLRGFREYQPGDPFKWVAWQASAAHGSWMVKQFSASTEAVVCLILNAQMFADYWSGARHSEFDRLCEMVSVYAKELETRGFELRFATNGVVRGSPSRVLFGQHSALSIRALLGEVDPYASRDFLTLWDEYTASAPTSETAVIFTSYEGREWGREMAQEQRKGRNIEMVFGPDPVLAEPVAGIPEDGSGVLG